LTDPAKTILKDDTAIDTEVAERIMTILKGLEERSAFKTLNAIRALADMKHFEEDGSLYTPLSVIVQDELSTMESLGLAKKYTSRKEPEFHTYRLYPQVAQVVRNAVICDTGLPFMTRVESPYKEKERSFADIVEAQRGEPHARGA
jgi:hypothetical protein